uniref:Transcriptional regulator, AraC family n=1 Tax=Parastrongyloides trichosuri TaxID=131310 RepID=A0A0N5A684_PARTI
AALAVTPWPSADLAREPSPFRLFQSPSALGGSSPLPTGEGFALSDSCGRKGKREGSGHAFRLFSPCPVPGGFRPCAVAGRAVPGAGGGARTRARRRVAGRPLSGRRDAVRAQRRPGRAHSRRMVADPAGRPSKQRLRPLPGGPQRPDQRRERDRRRLPGPRLRPDARAAARARAGLHRRPSGGRPGRGGAHRPDRSRGLPGHCSGGATGSGGAGLCRRRRAPGQRPVGRRPGGRAARPRRLLCSGLDRRGGRGLGPRPGHAAG